MVREVYGMQTTLFVAEARVIKRARRVARFTFSATLSTTCSFPFPNLVTNTSEIKMGGKTRRKGVSRRVTRTVLTPILDDPAASSIKLATRSKYTRKQLAAQTARNEERVQEIYKGECSIYSLYDCH